MVTLQMAGLKTTGRDFTIILPQDFPQLLQANKTKYASLISYLDWVRFSEFGLYISLSGLGQIFNQRAECHSLTLNRVPSSRGHR